VAGTAGPFTREGSVIDRALKAVRSHLGMEVAYLSEFVGGRSVFRGVDAPGFEAMAHVGGSISLPDVYCQHILEGRLPELIPDTRAEALTQTIPITQAVPIGSHMSIPVRRRDGSPHGMFCCLSRQPNPSLNRRDLETMRLFADVVAEEINRALAEQAVRAAAEARIAAALAPGGLAIVYQPIFELGSALPSGFEALCRVGVEPRRGPDVWFAEAAEVGRQAALEEAAVSAALPALAALPREVYLSVNASAETIVAGGLEPLLAGHDPERIMLELTEHAAVPDYGALERALVPLRMRGVGLAVDDAGAGYAGLQHILRLRPDVLKLDMALTRDIDQDRARRSLATALVHFARETRAVIVAEGIETDAELATLRDLGIQRGQGYLLGKPMDLSAAAGLFGGTTLRHSA
jgi:EAL domain-containing protein (putative c-di-GMP-specific phosphodiesterase class I)